MSRPNFRFKQFEVWHDKCAMKVGTDGVLLGAWCPLGELRSLGVQELGEFRSSGVQEFRGSGVQEFRSTSEQAQSASEQAQSASEQAQSASEQAQSASEQAQSASEQAQSASEQAQSASEQAQSASEQAQSASEQAQSASEQAQSASEPLNPIKVLDIGSGSGLIALMLAQRLSSLYALHPTPYTIHAIDIDAGAVEQSLFNFAQSPWAEHLACELIALQEYHAEKKFDLIVSNPPYFQASLKNPDQARATARHTDSLSYGELIRHAARLLSEHGTLALILPAEAEQEIVSLAKEQSLYPTHITYVHSKPGKEAKRILITFSHSTPYTLHATPHTSHLHIESASSPRSEEYQELTKDFYL